MVSAADAARIAQGLPNIGVPAAPKTGIFSSLAGAVKVVGGVVSPKAKVAAQVAGPALQGVGIGAGAAVGQAAVQPVKGILGWFADLKPDNLYGGMVAFAVLLYALDWITGFDVTRTTWLRVFGFGIGGFFILAVTGRSLSFWKVIIASVHFFSVYGLIDVLTGGFNFQLLSTNTLLIAFALVSGAFYINLPIPNGTKLLPLFMMFETFVLPLLRDRLLDYVAVNSSYIGFMVAFLSNRILFPLPLIYSVLAFYSESKTARKILGLLIIVYLIASLPQIRAAYVEHSGLTAEEQELKKNFVERLTANVRSIASGEFLKRPSTKIIEQAGITFGFGEPEEEPKRGLQLLPDRAMPKTFDYAFYPAPEPSAVMNVPVPLPLDLNHGAIDVVNIACNDKLHQSTSQKVSEPILQLTMDSPLSITNGRPRTAKCELAGLTKGSHTAEIKVSYKFHSNANFFTTFMRMDTLNELLAKGLDPAVAKKLPPARANYNNDPVAVTWGPVELTNSPASVDIDLEREPTKPNANLVIFVAKSPTWEGESEIGGITKLTLTVPEGVELETVLEGDTPKTDDEKRCSFEKTKGNPNIYSLKKNVVLKDPNKPANDFANFRLVGQSVQFSCRMKVSNAVLGGTSWNGAEFKTSMDYLVTSKLTVNFEVTGEPTPTSTSPAAGATPTSQQLQETCRLTFGMWQHGTGTCDCGGTDEWKGWPDGCKPAATKPATP